MLTNPTVEKLQALNLTGMLDAFLQQRESREYQKLAFEDRLGLLVDRELADRENRRLERYLKAAKLRLSACIEDLDFAHPRGLDRTQMLNLAASHWVHAHQQILIVGPTGAGKTYVACALANAAIRQGYRALYLRMPRLLSELATARGDGRLRRVMASWSRIDVLVVDDLALTPLTHSQAADFLEVIEDRCQLRSTIVTSQLPVSMWHEALGEPSVADAILDRLVHNAHRIELRGESLRRLQKAGPGDDPAKAGSKRKKAKKPAPTMAQDGRK